MSAGNDRQSFDKLSLEIGRALIGINPEGGGYVTSWQVKNDEGQYVDVLYQGSRLKRTGIPLLFPYYGDPPEQLNPGGMAEGEAMPSHGIGRTEAWEGRVENDHLIMELSSQGISEEARRLFPFSFAAKITVSAEADGSLIYGLEVKNTAQAGDPGARNLPLKPGLHPYWAVAHDRKREIEIDGIDGFDARALDWDHEPPDTPYEYNGMVRVVLPDKEVTIEDISTVSKEQPERPIHNIIVWSQTPDEDDYEFVCVEPVSGLDDGINRDPILVAPGKTFHLRIRFGVKL
jgi:galactose mutarotase-like enzyme